VEQGLIHRLANICKNFYVIRTIDDLFIFAGAENGWRVELPPDSYSSDRHKTFYGWVEGIKRNAPQQLDSIMIKVLKEVVNNSIIPDSERNPLREALMDIGADLEDKGIQLEPLMSTLARMFAKEGLAREVAVLTASDAHFEWQDSDFGITYYRIIFTVPLHLYDQVKDHIDEIQQIFLERIWLITRAIQDEQIRQILIVPKMVKDSEWRSKAIAWLNGQHINNQGRVRSDNVAPRTFEGLLFRSQQEILLFKALRSSGISIAPLPVFTRGGKEYQRIEPDFVIIKEGVMLVVEVDGDTFHHETPAEAYNRTTMLENEGARIKRIKASECDTPEKAAVAAKGVLETLAKLKAAGR